MAKAVKLLAERTGKQLTTKTSVELFDHRSWRSTGAAWLTRARSDMFRNQLLARWSHKVITHYARLAPLTGLTEHVRELQTVNSLACVIEELRTSVAELKAKHVNIEEHVIRELKDELAAKDDLQDGIHKASKFVVNTESKIFHKVRMALGAPVFWKARCGWKFGTTRFMWTAAYPETPDLLCGKCFYHQRIDLKCRLQEAALQQFADKLCG